MLTPSLPRCHRWQRAMTVIECASLTALWTTGGGSRGTVGRIWIHTKHTQPVAPTVRRSTRPPRPEVTSEGTSRSRVCEVEPLRRFLHPLALGWWSETNGVCSWYVYLAHILMTRRLDALKQHSGCQREDLSFCSMRPWRPWWPVNTRRI